MNIFKRFLPYLILILLLVVIKNNVVFILNFVNNGSALNKLEKDLADEKKKNSYLRERLYFVTTDQFVTNEAQEKLGMLPAGEYFVIAPTATPLGERTYDFDRQPNWRKWYELFF